ncbi:MAG: type II toxin-antitoxin system PemK/MazF family toxin [Deltaproteobacteria bacterium]|nr:type II toxin-antitoxin system PemK/MazF family toxin [Deltaproteobacteria bacterium]
MHRIQTLFPHSNLRIAKPRPALVIQADELQTRLPQLIVTMITSRLFRSNHPSRITVLLSSPESRQSGLLSDSVVMTDNIATIALSEIDRVMGRLPMARVDEAIRHTLGL